MDTSERSKNIRGLHEYQVFDRNGQRLGQVRGLWRDEATGDASFIAVGGHQPGRMHVVPLRGARLDHERRDIVLPFDEHFVRRAPSFDPRALIRRADEDEIFRFYGMSRGLEERRPEAERGHLRRVAPQAARAPAREDPFARSRAEEGQMPSRDDDEIPRV